MLLRLAEKDFVPSPLPFPVLHVDTGHNFNEVIEFRDRRLGEHGHKLIVGSVQESIDSGRVQIGGRRRVAQPSADPHPARRARGRRLRRRIRRRARDEERARAKERILSFRDEFGQWDPRSQRPEPWSLYNGRSRRASRSGCSR